MFDLRNARYRTSFINIENELLTFKAQSLDYTFMLEYITKFYRQFPDLFADEYVENRVGLKKILSIMATGSRNGKVLDVGCGNCSLLLALKKLGYCVSGIDASPDRVIANRKHQRTIFFGFSECMPFDDEEFKTVIATECLEHVLSADLALQEMRRVLKKGGLVYIQVPNKNYVDAVNHLRLFSADSLSKLVSEYFSVLYVECIPYLTGEHQNNIFCIARKA